MAMKIDTPLGRLGFWVVRVIPKGVQRETLERRKMVAQRHGVSFRLSDVEYTHTLKNLKVAEP